MRYIFLSFLIALFPLVVYSQAVEKEINYKDTSYSINSGMSLDDIIMLFGTYATVKNGDSEKPQYIWKSEDGDDFSVFLEKRKILIMILRSEQYTYKGLRVGDTIDEMIKILGEADSIRSEGANTTYLYKEENIRVDVSNKTKLVYGIFLNFYSPEK